MNSLGIELEGKYVVVNGKKHKGTDIEWVFYCEGGFGCSAFTMGRAVFGKFVFDGEECRIEGEDVERLATDEEVKAANQIKNK